MIRLVALLYLLKHLAQMLKYFAVFSGSSLAIFAAIRRASSRCIVVFGVDRLQAASIFLV
jgi:hypothetical protein